MTKELQAAARRAKDEERILVARAEIIKRVGEFQGFADVDLERVDAIFDPNQTTFMRRGDAERDPRFKQLVPYVFFEARDENGDARVFVYRRGKEQGERRLVSKWSCGIGGHVNDRDATTAAKLDDAAPSGRALFLAGARREIEEEVEIDSTMLAFEIVGLVNDDSSEVGRVHLGVVCRAILEAPRMRAKERELQNAEFRLLDDVLREIEDDPNKYETWTSLALPRLRRESLRR